MNKLPNIHPGEVLYEEFLLPMQLSANQLSRDLRIPPTRIHAIIKGKRRITADTALRLSKYFGTSAVFWLSLQQEFDLEKTSKHLEAELNSIPSPDKSL